MKGTNKPNNHTKLAWKIHKPIIIINIFLDEKLLLPLMIFLLCFEIHFLNLIP